MVTVGQIWYVLQELRRIEDRFKQLRQYAQNDISELELDDNLAEVHGKLMEARLAICKLHVIDE